MPQHPWRHCLSIHSVSRSTRRHSSVPSVVAGLSGLQPTNRWRTRSRLFQIIIIMISGGVGFKPEISAGTPRFITQRRIFLGAITLDTTCDIMDNNIRVRPILPPGSGQDPTAHNTGGASHAPGHEFQSQSGIADSKGRHCPPTTSQRHRMQEKSRREKLARCV